MSPEVYWPARDRSLTDCFPLHSQFTPEDSLVYGGNFVHTLAIPMRESSLECKLLQASLIELSSSIFAELKVCEIEVSHNEQEEHRFPSFMMCVPSFALWAACNEV